jgi:V/A-type H+-transporting ATPase subunit C
MAGGLLRYSGLVTKTRAMHGRLLSQETLYDLSEYESVDEFIGFLREEGSYRTIYQKYEMISHRSQVESVIDESLYEDYGKLYRFADKEQRQCLEILFLRYEINILKRCFWNVLQGKEAETGYQSDFLCGHIAFDLREMQRAHTVSEIQLLLSGTRYERIIRRLSESPNVTYADYAMELDHYFYEMAWKDKERIQNAKTKSIVTELIGTEIDWQNIMWMYRQKRFYDRNATEVYASIIPIRYRLRKPELRSLLEAENVENFREILAKSVYFTEKDAVVTLEDEISFRKVMDRVYRRACQKNPMSIAPVYQYLYDKEREIDILTTIMEGVRYRIPPREIQEVFLM